MSRHGATEAGGGARGRSVAVTARGGAPGCLALARSEEEGGWTRSGRVVELVCLGLGFFFLGANITGVLWAYYWAVLRPMIDQLLVRYSDWFGT